MLKNDKLQNMAKATIDGATNITLSIEEADQFLDYVVDQSALKNHARIVKMSKPQKYINCIGYGSGRVLKPAGTFSSSDYISTIDSNQVTLTTEKFRGCVAISDDDKEDLVGENVDWTDAVLKLIAKKIANEIEEIAWISDTHSLGGFAATDARSKLDGWRYMITHSANGEAYENDAYGSATILDAALNSGHDTDFLVAGGISEYYSTKNAWEHKYGKIRRAMPAVYKQINAADFRFFNHTQITEEYMEAVSARQTQLGDQAVMGIENPKYGLTPVVNAPLMSITLDADGVHDGGVYTDSLLTPKGNLVLGLQRELKLELYRDTPNERDLWFFSMRAATAIENVNACVICKNLTY